MPVHSFAKDLQHSLFRYTFGGKLALAPIDKVALHNVLDIATGTQSQSLHNRCDIPALTARLGTGVWAIEFGTPTFPTFFIPPDL